MYSPQIIVGDLFAGSGSAGEAARRAGRHCVGCDIDPEMVAKALLRLRLPEVCCGEA